MLVFADDPGCFNMICPAVVFEDGAWHVEKGFLTVQMAQSFVWDRDHCRELVIDSNVGVGD